MNNDRLRSAAPLLIPAFLLALLALALPLEIRHRIELRQREEERLSILSRLAVLEWDAREHPPWVSPPYHRLSNGVGYFEISEATNLEWFREEFATGHPPSGL